MTGPAELTHVFAGAHFDRLGSRRRDEQWLAQQWPEAAIVVAWDDRILCNNDHTAPLFLKPHQLPGASLQDVTLLGSFAGQVCFACDLGQEPHAPAVPGEFLGLRAIGHLFDAAPAALCALAQAMVQWHRRQRFCGHCGTRTEMLEAGYLRQCGSSNCQKSFFPRIDPAIIVLVEHQGRALLGRQPTWPDGMYSTIAGFVEPGESLEDAVRREVHEETGITAGTVRYHSSQPWPFPSSLMLGFHAQARNDEIVLYDNELEDARWFTPEDFTAGLRDGVIRVSAPLSISNRLITSWYDGDEPGKLAHLLASLAHA